MDLQKALEKGVDIAYKSIVEIPLPNGASFGEWLEPGVAVVCDPKHSDRKGIFSIERGMLTPLIYRDVKTTPSGLYCLYNKKGRELMKPDGVMLSDSNFDDAKELGEGFFAKKSGKTWAIFRIEDGEQISGFAYSELSGFSEGTCAVVSKAGSQIIGTDAIPVVPGFYEFTAPFKNGFARVGTKKEINYIDRGGRVIFAGAGRGSRDFVNGYAIIRDRKGSEGAIDEAGNVVITPQYRFMKDAENDRFVVSNTGAYQPDGVTFSGRNFGLIAPDGREVLPLKYSRVESNGSGIFKFGNMSAWQKNEGNRVITYGVLVFGEADADGRELLPQKYVSVGASSEGLRPFKSLEGSVMRLGYMREDGSTAIEIASMDYSKVYDFERLILREEITEQLRPFKDGRASVRVRIGHKEVGVFKKTSEQIVEKCAWYEIDKTGAKVSSGSGAAPFSVESPELERGLPFSGTYCAYKSNAFVNKALLDAAIEVNPFGDYTEVSFTFGFAILDKDKNVICGSDDGLPPMPYSYVYMEKAVRERCLRLANVAENVWLELTVKGAEKIVFSEFESPTRFSEGLAPFRKLVGKNKFLWGYMDRRGNVVVEPRYDAATAFTGGYAVVTADSHSSLLRRESVVTGRE